MYNTGCTNKHENILLGVPINMKIYYRVSYRVVYPGFRVTHKGWDFMKRLGAELKPCNLEMSYVKSFRSSHHLYIYSNLCVFVSLFDHNSWTPWQIYLYVDWGTQESHGNVIGKNGMHQNYDQARENDFLKFPGQHLELQSMMNKKYLK